MSDQDDRAALPCGFSQPMRDKTQTANTKIATRDNRPNRLVYDEAPRDNVGTARYSDLAAVFRDAFTRVDTAFRSVARKTPRYCVELLLEESVKAGIRRSYYQSARAIALARRDLVQATCAKPVTRASSAPRNAIH
jgi:hypothetical protein